MKKKILFALFIGFMVTSSAFAQSGKKKKIVEKPITGEVIIDLTKTVKKDFNLQAVNCYILSGKLCIDIADQVLNKYPPVEREKKSREIAFGAKNYFALVPERAGMLRKISDVGLTYMKGNLSNGMTFPNNILDSYTFRMADVK